MMKTTDRGYGHARGDAMFHFFVGERRRTISLRVDVTPAVDGGWIVRGRPPEDTLRQAVAADGEVMRLLDALFERASADE